MRESWSRMCDLAAATAWPRRSKLRTVGRSKATRIAPWSVSSSCPRCGERGVTVKAPDNQTECRHGGHFHCPECGYECDRDVVGALNVGRKHLSASKMERANPVAYKEAGDHASFPSPSPSPSSSGARSAGVQSATEQQDVASGRQTRVSQWCATPLTSAGNDTGPTPKRGESAPGGLSRSRGSETGLHRPSGSVTQSVLARTTDCG